MFEERSAGLVVFRMEKEKPIFILLSHRTGRWGFPKGNIEKGETEREAAIRETKEETGLSKFRIVDDYEERIEYFYRRKRARVHKGVVYFLAETEQKEVKLSDEHREYEWSDFDSAMKHLIFKNEKNVLSKANEVITQKLD